MNGSFQVFIDYVYLKKHFSDNNFIWCESVNYKKIKPETFNCRRDAVFFHTLYKHYKDRRQIIEHLVSCFLYDNNFWIGNALKEEYLVCHQNRMKRFGALETIFSNDCEKVVEFMDEHALNFGDLTLTNGAKLRIIDLYPATISLETLAILEHVAGIIAYWFPVNPLQKWRRLIVFKYQFLLRLNERNMEKIQNAYQSLLI